MSQLNKLWNRFKETFLFERSIGFSLDVSRVDLAQDFMTSMTPRIKDALQAMKKLEGGAIANPDEDRMVGHYWLRSPELAPTPEISNSITSTLDAIENFASQIHSGKAVNKKGEKFSHLLVIGIGGSALGPQFVSQALSDTTMPMDLYFFDNTDPDGMDRVLRGIPTLSKTLCVVISKSGGTKETRNGQLIAKAAFERAGLSVSEHFVAVTGEGSELDKTATSEKWRARFPMWDWVGGRTSELSAVGLLPAALQGFKIREFLRGASVMDEITRREEIMKNPAALLSLVWYHTGSGKGFKDMVILPYKDRLSLCSRYLQQLVMESLGKELDLSGNVVNQGIAVYGNKGSTDQHAYIQQLRDGVNNFFAVFIEVLQDSPNSEIRSYEVESGVTSGDYLSGFYQGTRRALYEKGRESVTISIDSVNEFYIGALIALFERAVGLYASLVNINAYHQPGVEAGKKAATEVLTLQKQVISKLRESKTPQTISDLVSAIGDGTDTETVFKILRHLAANDRVLIAAGDNVFLDRYSSR